MLKTNQNEVISTESIGVKEMQNKVKEYKDSWTAHTVSLQRLGWNMKTEEEWAFMKKVTDDVGELISIASKNYASELNKKVNK